MKAAGIRSVASWCTDTAMIAGTDSAKVGKVIRSGMRCTWRSITDTVMRRGGEQQQRREHPRVAVLHGELGERGDGDDLDPEPARRQRPVGRPAGAEDPRLRGHAEPRLRRR